MMTDEQAKLWRTRLNDLELVRQAAIESPLVELPETVTGNNKIFLKLESSQAIKSFKIRGATYAMASSQAELKKRGVVADSGGNHAQAVALAGRELGVPVTIVMAAAVPDNKVEATRSFGATDGSFALDTTPPTFVDAKKKAKRLAGWDEAENLPVDPENYPKYLSPYDDPDILRGTATIVPEVMTQLEQREINQINSFHVPIGGGGLIGGIADVNAEQDHLFSLIGHSMDGADSAARSLHSDAPATISDPNILAEGLAVATIGSQGHQRMLEGKIDDIYTSSVKEVGQAYVWYIDHVLPVLGVDTGDSEAVWNNLPELSSMVAVSGMFKYLEKSGIENQTHVVLISGGNINRQRSQVAIDAAND
ncbi:MAG: pyridoxal-phosphate dependent enzyme [bacterium]|nr:pyridoxal-phosphate dependent enzyme [bacterium]